MRQQRLRWRPALPKLLLLLLGAAMGLALLAHGATAFVAPAPRLAAVQRQQQQRQQQQRQQQRPAAVSVPRRAPLSRMMSETLEQEAPGMYGVVCCGMVCWIEPLAAGPAIDPNSHGSHYSTQLPVETAAAATKTAAAERSEGQVLDRVNFAIISHPDSGKTTLTEKLLLYGGAIQEAGAVRSRASQRKTQSDFMEMEKQRGISISSTVMSFQYSGFQINLLDTPGHADFGAMLLFEGSAMLESKVLIVLHDRLTVCSSSIHSTRRGHVPHAGGGRQRADACGRGQGPRDADAQALRGLPPAEPAHLHLHQRASITTDGMYGGLAHAISQRPP